MTVVKEISGTLKALVERLADAVGGIAELVEEIKVQAKEDGLSAKDIRELIVSALKKKNLADRTIRNYLPDFTKNQHAKEIGEKGNSSQSKPLRHDLPQQSEKTTTYKGDAGNDPELIKEYTNEHPSDIEPEGATAQWAKQTFTIDRKTLNQLNDIARERRAMNQFPLVATEGNRLEVGAV